MPFLAHTRMHAHTHSISCSGLYKHTHMIVWDARWLRSVGRVCIDLWQLLVWSSQRLLTSLLPRANPSLCRIGIQSWPGYSRFDINYIHISLVLATSLYSGYLCLSPIPSVTLYLSVCRSVCPETVLWQNGWLDLDVVCGGEWGRLREGCIRWGGDRRRVWGSFEAKCETSHCLATHVFSNLLWHFLFHCSAVIMVTTIILLVVK